MGLPFTPAGANTSSSSGSAVPQAASYLCLLTLDLQRLAPEQQQQQQQDTAVTTSGTSTTTTTASNADYVAVLPLPQQPLARFLAAHVSSWRVNVGGGR